MRALVWNRNAEAPSPVLTYSLNHPPLPSVPPKILENPVLVKTITENPHLFRVVTPLDRSAFSSLLVNHPNRPFVDSFDRVLREGAWPWAEIPDDYPTTWDNSHRTLKEDIHYSAVDKSIEFESEAGRYSEPFGPDLLPGMYSAPMGVVIKPHTDPPKYRVVFDYSAGQYSCNSMINRDDKRVPLDTIFHLGQKIRRLRKEVGPDVPLVVWKSDVSMAYRIIPLHPCWQIKQVVTWKGQRRVDWCNIWGFCAAGHLLAIVMSLVVWIAREYYGIDPCVFVDDCFDVAVASDMRHYAPYDVTLPANQCTLLELFDKLNVPHEISKQQWGEQLKVTGYWVDTVAGTISMSDQQRGELINQVKWFIAGRKRTFHQFQQMAGWINWGLNIAPVLRPCLSCMYEKMRGRSFPQQEIYINKKIRRDLRFFVDEFASIPGILMIESIAWSLDEADLVCYGDACLSGCGFFSPAHDKGFFVDTPPFRDNIFLFESYVVLCQIFWATNLPTPPRRLVVYSDNENTVAIFNTLKAYGLHNGVLLIAAQLLLRSEIELRVVWLRGSTNVVADAISRQRFVHTTRIVDRCYHEISSRAVRALARSRSAWPMSPSRSGARVVRTRWPIEKLVRERNVAIGSALALSSHKTYDSALKSWLNFVKLHDFSVEPNAETLSYYIAYESFHIEPRSVNSYVSGVISKLEPYFPDVRILRDHMLVYRTVRGCLRLYSDPVDRKRPLLLSDIKVLWDMLHSSPNFDDIAFLCLVATGFFSLQRLGELTRPDSVALRDYRRLPTRRSVKLFDRRIEYMLPVHKSDILFEGNKIVLEHVDDVWDPAAIFKRYIAVRDARFPLNPYLWLTSRGEPPSRSWVINKLQGVFGSSVAGHSIRSGGATFLSLKNVPDERIQAIGRWSSEAWKTYVRSHPVTSQALIWGRPTIAVR